MNRRRAGIGAAALAVVAGTVAIGHASWHSPPPPQLTAPLPSVGLPPGTNTTCSVDDSPSLSAYLNGLPANSDVVAPPGACLLVDEGVHLNVPNGLTISGGRWEDQNKTPPRPCAGSCKLPPVFHAIGGAGLTLENMTIYGSDVRGTYNGTLYYQSGILIEGTASATVTGVTISHVYGDCLTLDPLRSGTGTNPIVAPVRNFVGSSITTSSCGRQGIAPISVDGATFTNVIIGSAAMDSWDFEADTAGEGARNVTITGCSYSGLFNVTAGGASTGPITVQACSSPNPGSGDAVRVANITGLPPAGAITFSHDALRCGASSSVACLELSGANVVIEDSTIQAGFTGFALHPLLYRAQHSTTLSFLRTTLSGVYRAGSADATSKVVNPIGVAAP